MSIEYASVDASGKEAFTGVRSHVSLRVPRTIACRIDAYALANEVRKTDAYVHFLEIGLQAESAGAQSEETGALCSRMDEISEKIQAVLDGVREIKAAIPSKGADVEGGIGEL